MSAKDPFSILYKDSKQPVEKSAKVERYRPGKAPTWKDDEENEEIKYIPAAKPIEISTISSKLSLHPEGHFKGKNPEPLLETQSSTKNPEISLYPAEEYSKSPSTTIRNKPQFMSKEKRLTHKEREIKEQEEEKLLKELKDIQEEKKNRTKIIVAEAILKEEIGNIEEKSEEEESSDEENPEEFTFWKIREIKRIMRDKEIREQRKTELAEIERRRSLSDWERKEEDKILGNDESAKPAKQKIQFMQKYYNKGVYYQQRDEHGKLPEIFMRDYNAPVEGDFDKSCFPKILQKRRGEFGKKGQSKYTHLSNEDTTNFDPLFMPQQELFLKQQMKLAGFKSMNQFDVKKN